jgi:exonuclease SbcC
LASYQNSIAGELAEKLEVGKPCPVCGATEHPHLAVRGSNSATKEDVDVSIANTKAASDACSKAIYKKSSIKAKTEAKEKEVTAGAQESLGTDDLSAIPLRLEEAASDLQKESADTVKKIAAEAGNINTRKAEEAKVNEYAAKSKNIQKAITDYTNSLAEAKANVRMYSEKIAELSAKLTEYKDFNAAQAAMTEYANKAQQLQQESKKAEDVFNSAKSELDKCHGMIDSLKKNLEGAASYNLEELRSRKQQIDAKLSEINAAISVISHNLEQNKDAKKDIATKSAELKKIEDEYALLSALERTASGKMIGKDKITFETFVQMTYFDSVLRLANKRFLKMSDGQYELVRSMEQSGGNQRSGLVLDIIDHYNGTQRPANSMSGGEKFLASLSLALGLSDEIQSLSGGIQVDAMFVDEGFGTLDDEYLDRTCRALNELAENNTIVSIISHIKSLEDRIPRHLEVKKDSSGCSHAKFVI